MSSPYEYQLSRSPSDEILDRQTAEQLTKNYAVTEWNVYELDNDQCQEILNIALGSGNFFLGNWVESRPVTINGENLLRVKRAGSHDMIVVPCHS